MSNTIDLANIPEQLSDADARRLLDQVAGRARKISEDIVRNNTRAEQGQAQMATLQARAKEHFGTDDVVEMRRIMDERMKTNAQNVRAFLTQLAETETQLAQVSQPAPGR